MANWQHNLGRCHFWRASTILPQRISRPASSSNNQTHLSGILAFTALKLFNNCLQISNLNCHCLVCLCIRANRLNQSPRVCPISPPTLPSNVFYVTKVSSVGRGGVVLSHFPVLPLQWYYLLLHLEILEPFLQVSLLHFIEQLVLLAKALKEKKERKKKNTKKTPSNNFSSNF